MAKLTPAQKRKAREARARELARAYQNPIAKQLADIRAGRKADTRNVERYFKNAKGEWRKRIDGSRGSVSTPPPRGVYRDRSGQWRNAQNKHRRTTTPERFQRVPEYARDKSKDAKAARSFRDALERHTEIAWDVKSRGQSQRRPSATYPGTYVGWGSIFEFRAGDDVDLLQVGEALDEMFEERDLYHRTFANRRAMIRIRHAVFSGGDEWRSFGMARVFGTALGQAATEARRKAKFYVLNGEDPPLVTAIRISIQ